MLETTPRGSASFTRLVRRVREAVAVAVAVAFDFFAAGISTLQVSDALERPRVAVFAGERDAPVRAFLDRVLVLFFLCAMMTSAASRLQLAGRQRRQQAFMST